MPPPRAVLKCLVTAARQIEAAPPEDVRYLRGYNGPPVTVSLTLSALESNEPNLTPSSNLILGLAARFAPDDGRKRIVRLSALPWVREMAGWDANHWSWLLAILISQASDVLPNPEDSAGLILSLSYKVAPTRWAALHAEMPDAFDSVVTGDSRFRASDCCYRNFEAGTTFWISPEVDAHGDPALEFDTGFLWKRAQELLCAEHPLEDLSARPALCFFIGAGGEGVCDGKGNWYPTAFAYVKHRLDQVASPLPASERDNVLSFIWELLSSQRVGVKGGLGCGLTSGDLMEIYGQRRKKQPLPAAMKRAFKKYGISIPEMAAEGIARLCVHCSVQETPDKKHLSCACRAPAIVYCSKECQKAHWKAAHKAECATRKQKGKAEASGAGGIAVRERRQPSRAALSRVQKRFQTKGEKGASMPIPGTEDAEAWKVITQSMLLEAPSKMRAALEKELRTNAEREAEYWRLFPDAPNWALGTGFSTEEETMAHLKRKKN